MKPKYNKSLIMKRAWELFRSQEERTMEMFSACLKESWAIAKDSIEKLDFDSLYRKYKNLVMSYIRFNLTQPKEVAEELCNDTFIKAMQNIAYYDESKGKISTWLCSIAHRLTINNVRTDHRRMFGNVDDIQNEDGKSFIEPTDYRDASENVQNMELSEQIKNAMSRLTENQQKVAKLRFIDQCTYEEIAEILDMPVNRVGVIINRARAKMEELLTPVMKVA